MTMTKTGPLPALALLALSLALAGCGQAPRYQMQPPAPTLRLHAPVKTIELHQVSLPDYAAAPGMSRQAADGQIRAIRKAQWADTPARGMTEALARQLDTMLSATVAAEPWPLTGVPDADVTVRVTDDLAQADGQYRLAGTYYVSSDVARVGPASAGFDIRVPMQGNAPTEIAAAQGQALARLARTIATGIGR